MPYGNYDIACNAGWVGVRMNHDTSAFAVQTIRRWWQEVGCKRYPDAKCLTITCDGGGSNGSRVRLWKRELQALANELGIDKSPDKLVRQSRIPRKLTSCSHPADRIALDPRQCAPELAAGYRQPWHAMGGHNRR